MLEWLATFFYGPWMDSTHHIHFQPLSLSKTFPSAS